MPTAELDVLKPIDPSIVDSDEYEIYTLSNAQVFYVGGGRLKGKPASLLDAYADTPLRVEGTLEAPDRSQLKYLLKKRFKPVDLQILNVTRFSYGQTQDGEVVIWALGEAGWFELRPHESYEDIYDDMKEAVEILYFVSDIYNEPRKKGSGPSASLIFQEYAEDERFACEDPTEATTVFHKHRIFLMMSFLNRAQGVGWSTTPLYQYYKRQFPTDFEIAKARSEGRYATPKNNEKPSKSSKADLPVPKSRGRRKSSTGEKEKADGAPKKDNNWWEAMAIFEFMQKAVNRGAIHVGSITLEKLAKLVVKRYEIEDLDTARNVIVVHAINLCYLMDHPRRKNVQYFASEPIYEQLSQPHSLSAADERRALSTVLRPRNDHATLSSESESEAESADTMETPQRSPPRKKRGRLSVLRPKSGKYSGKGKSLKSGKGKGKAPINVESDSEVDEEQEVESENELMIDTPTQAPSPGKRKRGHGTADSNPRKRATSASAESEDIEAEPSSSPSSPSDEGQSEDISDQPLPLRGRSGNNAKPSSQAMLPPVISSPLPEYTANGPGDSWTCTFDGCSQNIYGVSTELGRRLIKEHLQDHAKGRQKEVALVMSEEQRLRLPVNNLIKKIREMSGAQQPLFPSTDRPTRITPSPIERHV